MSVIIGRIYFSYGQLPNVMVLVLITLFFEKELVLDKIVILGVEILGGEEIDIVKPCFIDKDIEKGLNLAVVVKDSFHIVFHYLQIYAQLIYKVVVVFNGLADFAGKVIQSAGLAFAKFLLQNLHSP